MNRRYIAQNERRRSTHRVLVGVILATLPCYFCGIILLLTFSNDQTTATPTTTSAPATVETATATDGVTGTPTATYTPGGPTVTLRFTPTQFVPGNLTPTRTPT